MLLQPYPGQCLKIRINGSADHGLQCEWGLELHSLLTICSCSITCLSLLRGRIWCNKYAACRITRCQLCHAGFDNCHLEHGETLSTAPATAHRYTTNRELSFQQAICYLSFRWVNILHAWTVNSVNRLVKNPKTHYSNPIISAFLTNCKRVKGWLGWRGECILDS